MTYEEFASGLPRDRTFSFTSAEEMEEELLHSGVYQPMRQTGKGKFRSHLAVLSTEQGDFFSDRYKTAISLYLEPPAGTVGILFPRTAHGHFLACGDDVGNDRLIVVHSGSGVDIVGPSLVGSEAIAVPEARFIEMFEALSPTSERSENMVILEGNTAELHELRNGVVDLLAQPELDPNGEQVSNLIGHIIAWMGDSSSRWGPENLTVNGARIRVAKLAQEFIEEHYRERVCIEDLCRVTGVGVRTLQRCFKEYFDLTVTEYLKTARLDAARRELRTLRPSQTTVATIALRNGFAHLGRFSIKFRERFGESPNETLAMRANRKSHFR
jgi:AraC-like DNA-binding protein